MMLKASVVDLETLPGLLRQYTRTLEENCSKGKAAVSGATAGLAGMGIGAVISPVLGGLMGFAAGAFLSTLYKQSTRNEAADVAEYLRHLVSAASQYGEHASKRIANNLELQNLLLAADRALMLYHEVFVRDGSFLLPTRSGQ